MKKEGKRFRLSRIFKLAAVGVAAVALATFFAGCKAEPKTFTAAGMSITLTDEFYEKSLVSQTAYYESQNAIVTAVKEEFSLMSGLSGYSVSRYTDMVISGNNLIADKYERDGKEYMYFSYKKTVTGRDFYYFATTHKSDDAFWLIQFACLQTQKDKYTDIFFGWADSITFNSTATI